jgi:hypothetical protein
MDYQETLSAQLRRNPWDSPLWKKPPTGRPDWPPVAEPGLEAVNPEDWVPSPKLMALTLVGALRGVGKRAIKVPQEEALLLAQQRAAMPVERNGLGLSPTNTAQERAAAMGFTTPAYHGTTSPDIFDFVQKFRPKEQLGFGTHVALDPAFANEYAIGQVARKGTSPTVLPLVVNPGNALDAASIVRKGTPEFELAEKLMGSKNFSMKDEHGIPSVFLQNAIDASSPQKAKKLIEGAGYNSVKYESKIVGLPTPNGTRFVGPKSKSYTVLNPDDIRSQFAAFDPWRRNAVIAALMGVAAPNLLAEELRK